MSELESEYVKRGLWVNWSQGAILGHTWTIDASLANVVVALLAICTSIGTGQLFNLLVFLYHQFRAHGKPSDGLYWQQQALLRTLPTPTALVADYLKLWWSWRTKSRKALLRSWPAAAIVLCYAIAAVAAGISTSYAVDTTNLEVLVDSPLCRLLNVSGLATDANASTAFSTGISPYIHTYTQNCYINETIPPTGCRNIFVQPKISVDVQPAACPWHSSMCLDEQRPAIAMDSGLVDVSREFGLNLRSRDNLWVRRKTTCNVLPLKGHEDQIDLDTVGGNSMYFETLPDEKGIGYRFGNYTDLPPEAYPEYLLKMSLLTANRITSYSSNGIIARAQKNAFNWGLNWRTLDEMNRTDADVAFTYISLNNVWYHNPVNDPLFSAHKKVTINEGDLAAANYKSDNYIGAMGCAVQHQFCASQSRGDKACTSLGGLPADEMRLLDEFTNLTALQSSLMKLLWSTSFLNDVTNAASSVDMLVSGLLMFGQVTELPDDQWVRELVHWENYAWAGFQMMLTDTAVGPITRNRLADTYTNAPASASENLLCQSIKMRKAGGFANVNVFAFAFVITFSAIISFINFFILRLCIFLRRFRQSLAPRLDRWVYDGVFQLQRRAFEASDSTAWADLEKEIPITSEGALMSELPSRKRTIRRSTTATTLVDNVNLEKWELEERQPTLTEHNCSSIEHSHISNGHGDLTS